MIYQRQRGVGLLELMLALVVITLLLILSIRSYQGYRARANLQLLAASAETVQIAASSFFAANCSSNPTNLAIGTWQSLNVLSDLLPGGVKGLINPLGEPFQFEFLQVDNQLALCVRAQLDESINAKDIYIAVNGVSYSNAPVKEGVFCVDSGSNAVLWQSIPSLEKTNFLNPQVVKRLQQFKKNNTSAASICQ